MNDEPPVLIDQTTVPSRSTGDNVGVPRIVERAMYNLEGMTTCHVLIPC